MSKSLVYAVNSTSQDVSAGGTVNFGSVVRRYGSNCNVSSGNLILSGAGYYDVIVNLNLLGSTAGGVTITLYSNGAAIPGATATVTAAVGSYYSVTIPAVVRNYCCAPSTITAVVNATDVTVESAAIEGEKK